MRSRFARWVKRPGYRTRLGLTVAVVVLAAIAFGLAATLVSDWLTGWWLVVVTLVMLALLAVLALFRDYASSSAGTLFYVRIGEQWMPDWHVERLMDDVKAHMDSKAISRDYLRHTSEDPARVDDVEQVVTEASRSLEGALNDDTTGTAYHLAPNMLWPAAVAVGYDLFAWQDLTLREYVKDDVPPTFEMPLEMRTPSEERDTETSRVYTTPETRHEARDKDRPVEGPSVAVVAVELSWWDESKVTPALTGFRIGSLTRVACFETAGSDPEDARLPVVVGDPDPTHPDTPVVQPHVVAEHAYRAIRSAIHANPERPVLVMLRVPKTAAVSLGHLLRTRRCGAEGSHSSGCDNPWEVLVPMNYEMFPRPLQYTPLRVHPHQPAAEEMTRRLQECLI